MRQRWQSCSHLTAIPTDDSQSALRQAPSRQTRAGVLSWTPPPVYRAKGSPYADTTAVHNGLYLARQKVSGEFLWQTVNCIAMRPTPAGASATSSTSIITAKNVIARSEGLGWITSGVPATTAHAATAIKNGGAAAARGAV